MIVLAVTGGRNYRLDWSDYVTLRRYVALAHERGPVEFRHGACRGADTHAAAFVQREWPNCATVAEFHADWKQHGARAGPIRNEVMLTGAESVIAFPGGRGTANAIETARRLGVKVYIVANGCCDGLLAPKGDGRGA